MTLNLNEKTTDTNPRYLAYCFAHGETDPDEMLARDLDRWPGGVMCGYILWINKCWRQWKKVNNRAANGPITDEDHQAFDDWLEEGKVI